MEFTVKVPASTSNLGPGFDTLGLALNLYNEYTFDTKANEFSFTSNLSQEQVPYSTENLAYRSFDYLFKKEGKETPAIKIHFEAGIPLTGGFGSSSTAIVAGLMAANLILAAQKKFCDMQGERLEQKINSLSRQEILDLQPQYNTEQLLKIGTQLDGHPDNISPAILGGFTVCVYAEKQHHYVKLPWNNDLYFVAIIPDFKLPTAKARAALPAQVDYEDAVHNIGYSSLLVAALAKGDTDTLKQAFKDRIHQRYRAKLVPGMQYVLDAGLEAGAIGTMLSGAGSTLIAVVDSDHAAQTVGAAMQAAWLQSGIKSEAKTLKAEPFGARID